MRLVSTILAVMMLSGVVYGKLAPLPDRICATVAGQGLVCSCAASLNATDCDPFTCPPKTEKWCYVPDDTPNRQSCYCSTQLTLPKYNITPGGMVLDWNTDTDDD